MSKIAIDISRTNLIPKISKNEIATPAMIIIGNAE